MRRRTLLRLAGGAATIGAAAIAGCAGGGGSTATPTLAPTTVEMVTEGGAYYFDPIGLHVEPGTTVTWRNASGRHSTTAYHAAGDFASTTRIPDGADPWNSGTLTAAGATFEHTFDVEGTYDYFCVPHKSLGMVGRLVVGDPGGPAAGSMPPDGEVPDGEAIVERGRIRHGEFA